MVELMTATSPHILILCTLDQSVYVDGFVDGTWTLYAIVIAVWFVQI